MMDLLLLALVIAKLGVAIVILLLIMHIVKQLEKLPKLLYAEAWEKYRG